ncbi:MAG TPA: preprotein translocase subunit SecG, partial [Terricaulis sp.]|nr:preprotein translocase subunit SecG [Terricaulis sp.]
MQTIILSIHLLVCVCLIGLVLLQRSEGGALGIGGGGGGALMSGRGASDALARLTYIAGGLFLAISLGLTWLSGAGQGPSRSVFDNLPAISAPAPTLLEEAPATEAPPAATPDPTESRGPSSNELAAAILPGPASASAAETAPPPASTRAAPIESRP